MEQKLISCGSNGDGLVAQNLEAEDDIHDQIFYTLHNPLSKYRSQIPEGRRIRGYFHDWLILSNNNNIVWSLWNPNTSKIICLPPLFLKDGDSSSIGGECCLSSPPDHPNSVLLLTTREHRTFVFCRLDCKRNKLRWTEMSYAKQLKRITADGCLLYNLTCCDGKLYALNTDGSFAAFVIHVDIVVKKRDVAINLLLFGACPFPPYNQCCGDSYFLTGSNIELFCIIVGFEEEEKKTLGFVSLHKLDMTSIKWEELEDLKNWDITGMRYYEELDEENAKDLYMTSQLWEEMLELKDCIFFVDLARDYSVFYGPKMASDLGGYIHIRREVGIVIYSYCLKDKNISISSMPFLLLPTSECTIDSKQEEEKDCEMVARLVTDDEVESTEGHLLNLPYGILEMIMEYCVGVEYMNFRATCTHCHLAAPLIKWWDETTLKRLQTYGLVSPWLMVVDEKQDIITFTDPLLGDKYFMKNIPVSIVDGRIRCSRYGWLLFYSDSGLVFYNPFTRDILKVSDHDTIFTSLCFSAPPTSRDCMIVGFTESGVYIHFVSGKPSWDRLHLKFDSTSYFPSPTFYGTDIYALCNTGELHVFKNLGEKDYSWELVVVEAPRRCCTSWARYFLMKRDQHLLLVIVAEFGESVEVFMLNDFTKKWEKIDGVGNHMIYISGKTCLCIEAKTSEMENKIYFSRLHCRNKKTVFYSLDTQTYHTFNGKNVEEKFRDFVGTIHQPFHPHAWIELSWS